MLLVGKPQSFLENLNVVETTFVKFEKISEHNLLQVITMSYAVYTTRNGQNYCLRKFTGKIRNPLDEHESIIITV